MKKITYSTFNTFRIGSTHRLATAQLKQLAPYFTHPQTGERLGLNGRASVSCVPIDGIGSVVIKRCMRGGLLGNVITHTYVRLGKPRPRIEYEQLERARDLGITVPEPICFAYRGTLFYTAWLVTREIENQISLARLSLTDPAAALLAVDNVAPLIRRLADNRIYHRDLHPGNVLVDADHRVYIIDFDKAGTHRGGATVLRKKYIKRWGRAVKKYGLPPMIHDRMCGKLNEPSQSP